MLKVTKRGLTEGVINTTVIDGRSIYKIFASINEKGKFDIIVKKNNKVFTLSKSVGTSVKGVNRKIMETTNFYNMGNNVKRLASLVEEQEMIEKRHKKAIRDRENSIKKEIERKKRNLNKVSKKEIPTDIQNILMSMSAVK